MITKSAAYRQDGLLLVLFNEAEPPDARACYREQPFPNTFNNGFLWPGRSGGHTGAVALSPFIKPGTVSPRGYNHFSQLKSIEQFFGLGYIGNAGHRGLRAFGTDIFTNGRTRAPRQLRWLVLRRRPHRGAERYRERGRNLRRRDDVVAAIAL